MTHSVRLIVLSHTKFGESSVVLHTLSEQFGRRSFLVRVGNKTPMAAFLPMSLIEADITENPKSTLWTARNFTTVHPLVGIRGSVYKNTITLFMSEVLYRLIHEDAMETGLAEWCEKTVLTLDGLGTDWSNYPIRFLLELSVALGFSPSSPDLAPFAGEYYSVLSTFLSSSFADSMLIPLSGADRNAISDILLRYLEYHTETTLNIRSLPVLRELYK